jgi:excisionase family DNA binding protein
MDSKEILLHGTTEDVLIDKIKIAIKEILCERNDLLPETNLLTREEVCQLLNINKTTLWNYTKKDMLKSYGIGSRVYYKRDEVIEALKPIK